MRTHLLAAMLFAWLGHGLACAEQPLIVLDEPASVPCFRASGEYLLWWFQRGGVPPLLTGGGNGVLGAPGTQVLVDNLDFNDDARQGGRFTLGWQFASRNIGVEVGYFFLADGQAEVAFASDGEPVLGQPFIDAATGNPNAVLVADPGNAVGGATVSADTTLWGLEANLTTGLTESAGFRLTGLAGFRFLNLDDAVTIDDRFVTFGNRVGIQDSFRAANRFYGGQVGLEAGLQRGAFTLDLRGKLGLGAMEQVAEITGETEALAPNGTLTILRGGVLAQRTNIGRHQRHQLAFVPEVGVHLGWQLTRAAKLSAGYSLLWLSSVARAGEQIDPVVNERQIPVRFGNQPFPGPLRPAFDFVGSSFWAQGVSVGLELRY